MKKLVVSLFSLLVLPVVFSLSFSTAFGQKSKEPFTGMLVYKISAHDTMYRELYPDNMMVVLTNDTISRKENFTSQLGKQVSIRHMELNKSYLLLTVYDTVHFAIKTDLNVADSMKPVSKYTFKKKCFKRKIQGMRANRMLVSHPDFKEPIEFLYLKKYSGKYLDNFNEIPGLPVKFSVVTPDVILDYELIKFKEYMPERDLFGIPSDYRRATLDEFMDFMFPQTAPGEEQN